MADIQMETVFFFVRRVKKERGYLNEEMVRQSIQQAMRAEDVSLAPIEIDRIEREVLSHFNVVTGEHFVLTDQAAERNWLKKRAPIEWGLWMRYKRFLEEEKNRPESVVLSLDAVTDDILNMMANPNQPTAFSKKGLVVGNIQSGKTQNFTGLICKAADVGYKIIIVLSGITEDLRWQTQKRLDEEFLGKNSETYETMGVGLYHDIDVMRFVPHTSQALKKGDFKKNKESPTYLGEDSGLLFVVKKNVMLLQNLHDWFSREAINGRIEGTPLLVIDDEADNASLTIAPGDTVKGVNAGIRRLLHLFAKNVYVGYTATPYANIFTNRDVVDAQFGPDLFPRDFIVSLPEPSYYLGPKELFGFDQEEGDEELPEGCAGLPIVCPVSDSAGTHDVPAELEQSVLDFVLSNTIRNIRGQTREHKSMLVHIERLKVAHRYWYQIVKENILQKFKSGLHPNAKNHDQIISLFQHRFESNFLPITDFLYEQGYLANTQTISFNEVKKELYAAVMQIDVCVINGDSLENLHYDRHPEGWHVIVVGGDKLSRGITLEGLSVSYYVRPSKAVDSLLQMGRWFGYRKGYLDVCRIYTTAELIRRYKHIAKAEYELRRDLEVLSIEGAKPTDFGLKVQLDPEGQMVLTNQNKLKTGVEIDVTYSARTADITSFHLDESIRQQNFNLTESWLRTLRDNQKETFLWDGVSSENILHFLKNVVMHPSAPLYPYRHMVFSYIEQAKRENDLDHWCVVVRTNTKQTIQIRDHTEDGVSKLVPYQTNVYPFLQKNIGLIYRAKSEEEVDRYESPYFKIEKAHLVSKEDEQVDLRFMKDRLGMPEYWERALASTQAAWKKKQKMNGARLPQYPKGPHVRAHRPHNRALLLLYPLDAAPYVAHESGVTPVPFIGYAISFPKAVGDHMPTTKYRVDDLYLRQLSEAREEENRY